MDKMALAKGRSVYFKGTGGNYNFSFIGAAIDNDFSAVSVFDQVLILSPNPFSKGVQITMEPSGFNGEKKKITIFDIKGRVVYSRDRIFSEDLSWDGRMRRGKPVNPGMYLVRVKWGKVLYQAKILKIE